LIIAASHGHDKFIELLLSAGADKDAQPREDFTALIVAAQNGHAKSIEVLLRAGADKDAKDLGGDTALIKASMHGHDKSVKLLLSAGCDVDAIDDGGSSALVQAVLKQHVDCVRTLVRAGADVSIHFGGQTLEIIGLITDRVNKNDTMITALRLPTSAAAASGEVCALCATTLSVTKRLRCSRCLAVCYC
jgi:ankyrin repeat protein